MNFYLFFFIYSWCLLMIPTGIVQTYRVNSVIASLGEPLVINFNSSTNANLNIKRMQLFRIRIGRKAEVIYENFNLKNETYFKMYSIDIHPLHHSVEFRIKCVHVDDLKSIYFLYVSDRFKWNIEGIQLSTSSESACEQNMATKIMPIATTSTYTAIACNKTGYEDTQILWILPLKSILLYGAGMVAPQFQSQYSVKSNQTHSILILRHSTASEENLYQCGVNIKDDSLEIVSLGLYSVCENQVPDNNNNSTASNSSEIQHDPVAHHLRSSSHSSLVVINNVPLGSTVYIPCAIGDHSNYAIIWITKVEKEDVKLLYAHGRFKASLADEYDIEFNGTHSILRINSQMKRQLYECRAYVDFEQMRHVRLTTFEVLPYSDQDSADDATTRMISARVKNIPPRETTTVEDMETTTTTISSNDMDDYVDTIDNVVIVLDPKLPNLAAAVAPPSSGASKFSQNALKIKLLLFFSMFIFNYFINET